jgi:hypothetical protein
MPLNDIATAKPMLENTENHLMSLTIGSSRLKLKLE